MDRNEESINNGNFNMLDRRNGFNSSNKWWSLYKDGSINWPFIQLVFVCVVSVFCGFGLFYWIKSPSFVPFIDVCKVLLLSFLYHFVLFFFFFAKLINSFSGFKIHLGYGVICF